MKRLASKEAKLVKKVEKIENKLIKLLTEDDNISQDIIILFETDMEILNPNDKLNLFTNDFKIKDSTTINLETKNTIKKYYNNQLKNKFFKNFNNNELEIYNELIKNKDKNIINAYKKYKLNKKIDELISEIRKWILKIIEEKEKEIISSSDEEEEENEEIESEENEEEENEEDEEEEEEDEDEDKNSIHSSTSEAMDSSEDSEKNNNKNKKTNFLLNNKTEQIEEDDDEDEYIISKSSGKTDDPVKVLANNYKINTMRKKQTDYYEKKDSNIDNNNNKNNNNKNNSNNNNNDNKLTLVTLKNVEQIDKDNKNHSSGTDRKMNEFIKVINGMAFEENDKAQILQLLNDKNENIMKIYEKFQKNKMSLTKKVLLNLLKLSPRKLNQPINKEVNTKNNIIIIIQFHLKVF